VHDGDEVEVRRLFGWRVARHRTLVARGGTGGVVGILDGKYFARRGGGDRPRELN